VINAYRKIKLGMSSGKCSVRIKGSSGIETPDSSGEIYNGMPFRKRIYRQLTSRGPTSMHASSATTSGGSIRAAGASARPR
jgi:hypothetical protein